MSQLTVYRITQNEQSETHDAQMREYLKSPNVGTQSVTHDSDELRVDFVLMLLIILQDTTADEPKAFR